MDQDDLPPKRRAPNNESFAGQLGLTFTGLMWVAVFALIAGVFLYAFVHWF